MSDKYTGQEHSKPHGAPHIPGGGTRGNTTDLYGDTYSHLESDREEERGLNAPLGGFYFRDGQRNRKWGGNATGGYGIHPHTVVSDEENLVDRYLPHGHRTENGKRKGKRHESAGISRPTQQPAAAERMSEDFQIIAGLADLVEKDFLDEVFIKALKGEAAESDLLLQHLQKSREAEATSIEKTHPWILGLFKAGGWMGVASEVPYIAFTFDNLKEVYARYKGNPPKDVQLAIGTLCGISLVANIVSINMNAPKNILEKIFSAEFKKMSWKEKLLIASFLFLAVDFAVGTFINWDGVNDLVSNKTARHLLYPLIYIATNFSYTYTYNGRLTDFYKAVKELTLSDLKEQLHPTHYLQHYDFLKVFSVTFGLRYISFDYGLRVDVDAVDYLVRGGADRNTQTAEIAYKIWTGVLFASVFWEVLTARTVPTMKKVYTAKRKEMDAFIHAAFSGLITATTLKTATYREFLSYYSKAYWEKAKVLALGLASSALAAEYLYSKSFEWDLKSAERFIPGVAVAIFMWLEHHAQKNQRNVAAYKLHKDITKTFEELQELKSILSENDTPLSLNELYEKLKDVSSKLKNKDVSYKDVWDDESVEKLIIVEQAYKTYLDSIETMLQNYAELKSMYAFSYEGLTESESEMYTELEETLKEHPQNHGYVIPTINKVLSITEASIRFVLFDNFIRKVAKDRELDISKEGLLATYIFLGFARFVGEIDTYGSYMQDGIAFFQGLLQYWRNRLCGGPKNPVEARRQQKPASKPAPKTSYCSDFFGGHSNPSGTNDDTAHQRLLSGDRNPDPGDLRSPTGAGAVSATTTATSTSTSSSSSKDKSKNTKKAKSYCPSLCSALPSLGGFTLFSGSSKKSATVGNPRYMSEVNHPNQPTATTGANSTVREEGEEEAHGDYNDNGNGNDSDNDNRRSDSSTIKHIAAKSAKGGKGEKPAGESYHPNSCSMM